MIAVAESSSQTSGGQGQAVLLIKASSFRCAVAASDVVEVMRPMPLNALAGVPAFVRGVSVIRGESIPVIDLGIIMGGAGDVPATRLVVLHVGERKVALAVEAILGVVHADQALMERVPPLLRDACAEIIESIGVLDQELYLALQSARIVPDELWPALARQAAA